MSPELGILLADIGLKAIDGLGSIWAESKYREKKKEELQEMNDLRASYAERINGPGSGGGTAAGHLGEVGYLNYFLPALQSTATTGYYQIANHFGNKAYENYLKRKKAEAEAERDAIRRPNEEVPAEDLNKTIAEVPAVDPETTAFDNHWLLFLMIGMTPMMDPVGRSSQNFYTIGNNTLFRPYGIIQSSKKGNKLIPRQK